MAETYNEDVEAHLHDVIRQANQGIRAIQDIERLGRDLTATAKTARVTATKAACGHSPCPVADNYQGNARPDPVEPEPEPEPAPAP